MATKSLHPDLPICEWPFEDLIKQFCPLLYRYSSYAIPNYEYDDLQQELLITLFRCQQGFTADERAGIDRQHFLFYHYFRRAATNRLGTINWRERKKHGRNDPLSSFGADEDREPAIADHNLIGAEMRAELNGLSNSAKKFVRARLMGEPIYRSMKRREVREAKLELQKAL